MRSGLKGRWSRWLLVLVVVVGKDGLSRVLRAD